jgi:hypothetical protein
MKLKWIAVSVVAAALYQTSAMADAVCTGTLGSEQVQLKLDRQDNEEAYAQLVVGSRTLFNGRAFIKRSEMYVDGQGHRQEKLIYGTWDSGLDVFAKNSEAAKPFEVLLVEGVQNLTCTISN